MQVPLPKIQLDFFFKIIHFKLKKQALFYNAVHTVITKW